MSSFFFFNDTATTEIYTLSLHDALPISVSRPVSGAPRCEVAPPKPIIPPCMRNIASTPTRTSTPITANTIKTMLPAPCFSATAPCVMPRTRAMMATARRMMTSRAASHPKPIIHPIMDPIAPFMIAPAALRLLFHLRRIFARDLAHLLHHLAPHLQLQLFVARRKLRHHAGAAHAAARHCATHHRAAAHHPHHVVAALHRLHPLHSLGFRVALRSQSPGTRAHRQCCNHR